MKLLVIGDAARCNKYLPDLPIVGQVERMVFARGSSDDELLAAGAAVTQADFLLADAISPVSARLIAALPKLKLIHSEGVAYNGIDLAAARRRGIPVCNCKGVNAGAVAEQAVLLMLACLRDVVGGDAAVRAGRQIQTKERLMVEGIRELGECSVGFIGAGDIAQATMRRLGAWGSKMLYYKRTPLAPALERELGAAYAPLGELLAASDIVSLHVPVTAETAQMVDAGFLAQMRPGSVLINTARGEVVDQLALGRALEEGRLAAAGLDTLDPEPVLLDNSLLGLSAAAMRRIVFSPHVGGITTGTFQRAHRIIWENIARVVAGEQPVNIVNWSG